MNSLPRFDATNFTGVTADMQAAYAQDGVLVLDHMISLQDCDALKARMAEMVADFDPSAHKTVFSSQTQGHARDDYFLSSGSDIRFFFEEDGVDANGNLTRPKDQALNKAGHAMHDLDPVFGRISRQDRLKTLACGLGMTDPLLLQSMYIFKQPRIGGEVACHQDATFLWTRPQTVVGLWIALEDATQENGCLWGIPGAHKGANPKERFERYQTPDGQISTRMVTLDAAPFEEERKLPLEAPKGTLIAFSALFPHMSGPNLSDKSRHAYTLHLIDRNAHYPDFNWLTRSPDRSLTGF